MKRLALIASLWCAACGGGSSNPGTPEAEPEVFIALQRDLEGYESWEPFRWSTDQATTTHAAGERTVYLNKRPESGRTTFPVGTIIVKVAPDETGEIHTFAMAKRGGGFNQEGASGWEWFELAKASTGVPAIVWRGVGAPAGHTYSQVDASCNVCHQQAAGNDFVQTPALQLSSF